MWRKPIESLLGASRVTSPVTDWPAGTARARSDNVRRLQEAASVHVSPWLLSLPPVSRQPLPVLAVDAAWRSRRGRDGRASSCSGMRAQPQRPAAQPLRTREQRTKCLEPGTLRMCHRTHERTRTHARRRSHPHAHTHKHTHKRTPVTLASAHTLRGGKGNLRGYTDSNRAGCAPRRREARGGHRREGRLVLVPGGME